MKTQLIQKFEGKPPREAPPPSRWGKSRTGTAKFVVRKVGFRNKHGAKLYRLGYLMAEGRPPLFSQQLWTLAQLNASGVVWLKEPPFAGITEEPTDTDDLIVPKDAIPDQDEEEEPKAPVVAPVAPAEPGSALKVGDICKHTGGNTYRIVGIVDKDICRVEQVLADGKKTPARNMAGTKLTRVNS